MLVVIIQFPTGKYDGFEVASIPKKGWQWNLVIAPPQEALMTLHATISVGAAHVPPRGRTKGQSLCPSRNRKASRRGRGGVFDRAMGGGRAYALIQTYFEGGGR